MDDVKCWAVEGCCTRMIALVPQYSQLGGKAIAVASKTRVCAYVQKKTLGRQLQNGHNQNRHQDRKHQNIEYDQVTQ